VKTYLYGVSSLFAHYKIYLLCYGNDARQRLEFRDVDIYFSLLMFTLYNYGYHCNHHLYFDCIFRLAIPAYFPSFTYSGKESGDQWHLFLKGCDIIDTVFSVIVGSQIVSCTALTQHKMPPFCWELLVVRN